jgi:hypothetical protein
MQDRGSGEFSLSDKSEVIPPPAPQSSLPVSDSVLPQILIAANVVLSIAASTIALMTLRESHHVGFFSGGQSFAIAGIGLFGLSIGLCVGWLTHRRVTMSGLAWRVGLALFLVVAGCLLIGETRLFIRY